MPSPESNNEYGEFVTIMETSDRALIVFIKSIFEEAGINYYISGESLLNLGRASIDVKVKVEKNDAQTAEELLKELIK